MNILQMRLAKEVFGESISNGNLSADQIHFVDQIISYLTQNGIIEPEMLFEARFTELQHEGVAGLFEQAQVDVILEIIESRLGG